MEGKYKYDNLQSLQDCLAGKTKVATRDDYENEALYTKMTRHYNVISYNILLVTLSSYQLTEFGLFKYTIKGNPKKQINFVRPVGKGRVWKVKCNVIYTYVQ